MNTDSAFKVCPRCSGLASERTDKCLSCGYRRRFVFPDASDVLKVMERKDAAIAAFNALIQKLEAAK